MLKDLIVRLCALAVFQLIAGMLLRDGSLKKTVTFCVSLLFTAALLSPIFQMLSSPGEIFPVPQASAMADAGDEDGRRLVMESAQQVAGDGARVVEARFSGGVLTEIIVEAPENMRDEIGGALALRFGGRVEITFWEVSGRCLKSSRASSTWS